MEMNKEEILNKFREMFFGEQNNLIAKNFLSMERRRIELADRYNNKTKKKMDTIYKNGRIYLKFDMTFSDEISRQIFGTEFESKLEEMERVVVLTKNLFEYLESEEIDIESLTSFFQNLFNNYIKIINSPKRYERPVHDKKHKIDSGFADFRWDNISEMQAMIAGANKIEEFTRYLEERGIHLNLQPINLNESNPIVKAANKDKAVANTPDSSHEEETANESQEELNMADKINELITKKHVKQKANVAEAKVNLSEGYEITKRVLESYGEICSEIENEVIRILLDDKTIDVNNGITLEQYRMAVSKFFEIIGEIEKESEVGDALERCREYVKDKEKYPDEIEKIRLKLNGITK